MNKILATTVMLISIVLIALTLHNALERKVLDCVMSKDLLYLEFIKWQEDLSALPEHGYNQNLESSIVYHQSLNKHIYNCH